MDWLARNWSVVIAGGGVLAVLVGFADAETTAHLGIPWDQEQIRLGLVALIATGPPAAARVVAGLRGR